MLRQVLLFCFVACILSRAQTTIHVPADQPTIQAGINAAMNGDTVLVADGHYHEHLNFNGKNITVTSVNGPAATIIDGDVGTGPVVRMISNEGRGAVVHGFTIEHGSLCCFPYEGGGIEIVGGAPTITGNMITLNSGAGDGGGINSHAASPLIDSNTISQNTVSFFGGTEGAGVSVFGNQPSPTPQISNNIITGNYGIGFGGGIGLNGAGPTIIINNRIADNRADSEGGGIDLINYTNEVIVQNLVTGNTAGVGSGIYTGEPSGSPGFTMINNTVAGNNAVTDAAVVAEGFNKNAVIENNIIVTTGSENGLLCNPNYHDGPPIVRSNDVFSSQGVAAAYAGDCTGFSGMNGNISADPQFVSASNFHLLSGSPAIDTGDNSAPNLPTNDFDGNPRIVDGDLNGTATIDMGVYELQPYFTMSAAVPSTITLVNGAISVPIAFQISGRFFGTVTLSCPGAPAGVSCNFSPSATINMVPGIVFPLTMNIVTSVVAAPGNYSITLSASAAGITVSQTQLISLTVNAGTGTSDLSVTATHSPNIVRVGGPLTVTFTVGNNGADVTGVNLTAVFTGRVLSVVPVATQGSCTSTIPVSCSLGPMANGGTATVTITVVPGLTRSITATGVVSSNASDTDTTNNIRSTTGQVRLRPFARK